jgi:hypothetical protein
MSISQIPQVGRLRGFGGGYKVLAIGGFWGDNAASYDMGAAFFLLCGAGLVI